MPRQPEDQQPAGYRPRIVDAELSERLAATGAVVIDGPKACGKTATARTIAASEVLFDVDENARAAAALDPAQVLDGETPRLIDEWQLEPAIWNHVRREIDNRKRPGQFILTGSATPADDLTRHTGAGRITRLRMRPMTLFEAGRSSGNISLQQLFAGEAASSPDPKLTIADIAQEIAIGGWPGTRDVSPKQAIRASRDYLDEIRRVDISTVSGSRHNPEKVGQLLRSLARNVSTYVSISTLASDADGADGPLRHETASEYLSALERLMVVENQPAWSPKLRSRAGLRAASKRHFVDPSLAVAALRTGPFEIRRDLKFLGFLFESLVIRDLRVYAQAIDGDVLQYRDSSGLEVDAVVQLADGRWGAFEIKLGTRQIDMAAASLTKFAAKVDTQTRGNPIVLGVIVGTGYGYVRDDGIAVIPIGALGP